jgi:hypothetical protein
MAIPTSMKLAFGTSFVAITVDGLMDNPLKPQWLIAAILIGCPLICFAVSQRPAAQLVTLDYK